MPATTPPTTAAWDRTAYELGGDAALVFYVVYAGASVAPTLAVSAERHRTRGLPDGVNLVVRTREDPSFAAADFAVEPSAEAALEAETAELQFVLAGAVEDPADLLYVRDVVGVVTALLEAGATAVFDLQTMRLWSALEFVDEVFAPDAPVREMHVAFLRSDEPDGRAWFHTRGLRKFGRPDVSIHGVPEALADEAATLLHRFAELGIRGGIVPEGMRVVLPGWPEGWTCHHDGSPDDPDFNNVHVELRAPRSS